MFRTRIPKQKRAKPNLLYVIREPVDFSLWPAISVFLACYLLAINRPEYNWYAVAIGVTTLTYFARSVFLCNYKIGITMDLDRRLTEINNGCPRELKVVATRKCNKSVQEIETMLHARYSRNRRHGEWFKLNYFQYIYRLNGACKK